jgi:hypothetical protein
MSKVFDSQIKHYTTKFYDTKSKLSKEVVLSKAKSMGLNESTLKAGLLDNSNNFRVFAFKFAGSLMPGKVSCTTYAAVIAAIAETVNVPYTTKAGFCLQENSPQYEKNLSEYKAKKASSDDEHPFFATHVYVEIMDKSYEYYNGDTAHIDHLDVVTI